MIGYGSENLILSITSLSLQVITLGIAVAILYVLIRPKRVEAPTPSSAPPEPQGKHHMERPRARREVANRFRDRHGVPSQPQYGQGMAQDLLVASGPGHYPSR